MSTHFVILLSVPTATLAMLEAYAVLTHPELWLPPLSVPVPRYSSLCNTVSMYLIYVLFEPWSAHTVATARACWGGCVLASCAQVALLGAEVWLVGAVGTLDARALALVVARFARETRVASAANIGDVVFDERFMVSSIQAEELQQALEIVDKGGAGWAIVCSSRRVPHAHVARCLSCC